MKTLSKSAKKEVQDAVSEMAKRIEANRSRFDCYGRKK